MVPERGAIGGLTEREDFLHTTVAVRGDDKNLSGDISAARVDANHGVVMKLALLPVIEQLVATSAATNLVKKSPESQLRGESLNAHRVAQPSSTVPRSHEVRVFLLVRPNGPALQLSGARRANPSLRPLWPQAPNCDSRRNDDPRQGASRGTPSAASAS